MTLHNGSHGTLKEGRLTSIQSSYSRELSKLTTTELNNKLVKEKKWISQHTFGRQWQPQEHTHSQFPNATQAQLYCLSGTLHKSRWANLVRDLMVRRHQSQPTFCSALCLANKQSQSQILETKNKMNQRKSTYLPIFLRLVVISHMTQYR